MRLRTIRFSYQDSFRKLKVISVVLMSVSFPFLAYAGPVSNNYELKDFSFGAGGTSKSDSTSYSLFGLLGETESGQSASSAYKIGEGLVYTLQANTPPAPSLTNPSSYYNKLKLIINTGSNPSDAKFAVAISTDNFSSDTKYVQNDNTVNTTLGTEDWQTYTNWGGASGINIIGLTPGTTYTVKIAAQRGNFTETGYGPTAQATTSQSSLTFDIDVASTDTETDPPFTLAIGDLTAASVITAPSKVWVDVDTNGTAGAAVYVYSTNSGLNSSRASYTISSLSGNLASVSEGYGARGSTATQSSGGPFQIVAPYDGSGDVVGVVDGTKRIMFDSASQSFTAGRASFEVKAKASAVTKAASDYTDTLTVIVSATF